MPDGSTLSGVDPGGLAGSLLQQMQQEREQTKSDQAADLAAFQAASAKAQEAAPKPVYTPPQEYSGLALAIASLGGLLTHTPITTAANAMSGVLDAYHQNDAEKSKQQFEQWKLNHDAAIKAAELESKAYTEAGRQFANDARGYHSMMIALTSAFKNEAISKALAEGNQALVGQLVGALRTKAGALGKAGTAFTDDHTMTSDLQAADKEYEAALKGGDSQTIHDAAEKRSAAYQAAQDAAADGRYHPSPKLLAQINKVAGEAVKATGGDSISDKDAQFVAERVLAGDERATTGMARSQANISKVTHAVRELAEQRGISGAEVATRIAEFQGTIAGERTLGARTANMEVAANEAKFMAPLALEASKQVSRTDYPNLNAVLLAAERGTGDPQVVRFGLAANSLIYTYAKFLNPTGIPTDADKARATDILSTAWAEGQFEAAVDQIRKEIKSGQAAIGQTRAEFREGLGAQTKVEPPTTAQPLPADKAALVAGQTYQTRHGPAKWTGDHFEAVAQ